MKKMALLLMFVTASLYGQTWIRSYQWNDLCPGPYTSGSADVWNVIPAIGGGYLLQGHVEFSSGDIPAYEGNAFWLIDETGNIVWRRANDMVFKAYNSVVSNGIDRYYCLASSNGVSYLNVYDAEMNFLNHYWFQQVNGYDLQLNDMQYVDDVLVFAGQRNGQGVILKTDFAFNVVWQNNSIYLSSTDGFHSIRRTSTNGLLSMARDVIAKYNATGDTLWTARIPPVWQRFFCVVEHSNGGIYALKRSYTERIWQLDSYESNGIFVESINTGVPTLLQLGTTSMQETTDGNLVIYIASDHVLNKVSLSEDTIWSRIYPLTTTGYGSKNMCINDDGYIVFCGSGSLGRFTLIKANGNGEVSTDDSFIPSSGLSITNYPNPFNPSTTLAFSLGHDTKVNLCIYNIRGQKVRDLLNSDMTKGLQKVVWDGKDNGNRSVSSGLYFVRLDTGNKSMVKKVMLLK